MKRITAIQIAIIFIIGLIPILWLREGYIISNGDNIPASLNAAKTFSSSFNMWSPDFLGYASPNPSYLLNSFLALFFSDLGLSVGVIQILFQILLYMGAGFSMYYFTRKIYTNQDLAPFFAALFYMLNFFILMSRFNLGFAWTYAFLPLILALFVVSVNSTCKGDKKAANLGIIGFALVSIVPFSIASVNPANIALFLISLAVLAIYLLVKYRKALVSFALTLGKLGLVTFLVNIWWLLPMINTFFISPQSLGASVNVVSWSWTHQRASFLNLFWLNGTWGWNTYYIPKSLLDWYTNPVVAFLMFVPFVLAGAALLFKSNKSRFNAFIAFCILIFVFVAKGVHEPLEQLNLLLYQQIPLMSMFREPASKFTLIIIPFLALLIGYTANHIIKTNLHFRPKTTKFLKILFVAFMIGTFLVSALPLFTGFADTKTEDLPYSSYIKIPQYWFQATDWINNQQGDFKVLLTPLDDFYEMPYTWGYFGTDVLLERLFEKPIVSTSALDGYLSNPGPAADLAQIKEAAKFNRTDEFKAMIDVLNIKYIVQRNDVDSTAFKQVEQLNNVNITKFGRNLMLPTEMQVFFANQPYLKLVRSFGELDIYEYTQAKPSFFALLPSTLKNTDIYINKSTSIDRTWNFSFEDDFEEWKNSTPYNQSLATCVISQKNGNLTAHMWNLTSSWITVYSPLVHTDIESSYLINATFSAKNNRNVTIAIAEYSENMALLTTSSLAEINYGKGTFDSWFISRGFEPQNENTEYFQIQMWNYFNSTETSQSSLMVDNVGVHGVNSILMMTGLDRVYQDIEQKQNTLQTKSSSLTKTVIAVNATQPFILATTQSLDKSWIASMNGVQISPTSTYLGLKGFMIKQTGQFDIILEYKPQQWFNYSLIISCVTVLFLCVGVVYLQRTKIRRIYQKIRYPKRQQRL